MRLPDRVAPFRRPALCSAKPLRFQACAGVFSRLERERSPCVEASLFRCACRASHRGSLLDTRKHPMNITFTDPHIMPIVAIVAGILILIVPRLLSFIVAVFLLIYGLQGIN